MLPKTLLLFAPLLLAGCGANVEQKQRPVVRPAAEQEGKPQGGESRASVTLAKVASDFLAVTPPSKYTLHDDS